MAKAAKAASTPAKTKKAKLDSEGLGRLGLEKLTSLILEEVATNRPLKNRVMAALASLSGPEDVAKVIDKRLVSLENVQTSVKGIKARQLVDSIASLLTAILSDIAGTDAKLGVDLLIRFLGAEDKVRSRFRTDYPKLDDAFREAGSAMIALVGKLAPADQQAVVNKVEPRAFRDFFGTWMHIARMVIPVLKPDVLTTWQASLRLRAQTVQERFTGAPLEAVGLLQQIALARKDLDDYIALEEMKPRGKQDPIECAELLYAAGRYDTALHWVRIRKPLALQQGAGKDGLTSEPVVDIDQIRLEAQILDALKDRKSAQQVRWAGFEALLDAEILREYIAKADDFAEFEELDRAFAFAIASPKLYTALSFLLEWPKLDLAARFVVEKRGQWDGRHFAVLSRAATALKADYPLAATIVLRSLVTTILERNITPAFEQAILYYRDLSELAWRLEDPLPVPSHGTFVLDLEKKHSRKYGFWNQIGK